MAFYQKNYTYPQKNFFRKEIMNKKILFNITEDWFFCSHFLERALVAKEKGYSVFVICKENKHKKFIENHGISFHHIPFNRKSINPIYELFILFKISQLMLPNTSASHALLTPFSFIIAIGPHDAHPN